MQLTDNQQALNKEEFITEYPKISQVLLDINHGEKNEEIINADNKNNSKKIDDFFNSITD